MLLKKVVLGVCFILCLGYFYSPIFADTVVLKSGQRVEGKIIENTGKYVKMDFNGVELTYFQEEIASINQGQVENPASKELISLYEAFKSSKNIKDNKNLPDKSAEPEQPTVNQIVQNTTDAKPISLPNTVEGANQSATIQAALSQLPKEYQEMVKSQLQNMQSSNSAGKTPGATDAGLSSLSPEYQQMIKSNLEKLQPNTQEVKK